jgi:uncharacterized protein (UPF0335 family)
MSLTTSDLQEIGNVIESALAKQTQEIIEPLQNEIQALRNDIKEIYNMLSKVEKIVTDKDFEKLTLENQLLALNSKLLYAATKAGITLPR